MRKGLGKGKGKGYKNLAVKDPAVHSMSAKGVKQKTALKPIQSKVRLPFRTRMNKLFTNEEKRVLKLLNYTYYKSQNQWSLDRGEMFIMETQLGYSNYKAKKIVIKALDIFEEYSHEEVLKWLGFSEEDEYEKLDYDEVFPSQTQGMRL